MAILETAGVILRPLPSDEFDKPRAGWYSTHLLHEPDSVGSAWGIRNAAAIARRHSGVQPFEPAPATVEFWRQLEEYAGRKREESERRLTALRPQ
jgi:hypothetical protein